jgi:hypothetical protein
MTITTANAVNRYGYGDLHLTVIHITEPPSSKARCHAGLERGQPANKLMVIPKFVQRNLVRMQYILRIPR